MSGLIQRATQTAIPPTTTATIPTTTTNTESTTNQKKGTTKQKKATTMQEYVKMYEAQIEKALPKTISTQRFMVMMINAFKHTPKLTECTPQSVLGSMLTLAQLGLEPNTPLGQAYLIPYRRGGVMQCELQIGYKGLVDLAYRSGELYVLESRIVYEGDIFECELGLNPKLKHIPQVCAGNPKWVYALCRFKNGATIFEVMTIESIKEHAKKFSKSFNSDTSPRETNFESMDKRIVVKKFDKSFNSGTSPWETNFESMAKKTVVKKLVKLLPLKTELVHAGAVDEATTNAEVDANNEVVIVTDYSSTQDDFEQPLIQEETSDEE